MPWLLASSAPPGGTMGAVTRGTPGALLLLRLALPGPLLHAPGVADPFRLDPPTHLWAAFGTAQPLNAAVAVPAVPSLRGVELAWQAVELPLAGGWFVSQPAITFAF